MRITYINSKTGERHSIKRIQCYGHTYQFYKGKTGEIILKENFNFNG